MQVLFLKRRLRREGSSSNRCYCSNNNSARSSSNNNNNNNNNNNEKEEFEKIKKLSNTTNDEEEKKKTKSYSYALVTKRTPPRKDLGTFRLADDQMACGVRVDLNESTFVDFKSDENVHAEIRKVRGRRETKSGGGKFREEFIEQTVRGRVQKELILKIFYRCFLFIARKSRPLYIIKSIDILL